LNSNRDDRTFMPELLETRKLQRCQSRAALPLPPKELLMPEE